jgi:hypothetical protein
VSCVAQGLPAVAAQVPPADAAQDRLVRLAFELAAQTEERSVRQERPPGPRADAHPSRPVVLEPAVRLAARLAPAVRLAARLAPAARLGWLLPPSDQQPLRLPDLQELQVGFPAPGAAAAAPGYEPAALPEQPDRAEQSTRVLHSMNARWVRVAPAA